MKQSEINKCNFLIALFLGAKKDGGSTIDKKGKFTDSYSFEIVKYPLAPLSGVIMFHDSETDMGVFDIRTLHFHCSWEWLTPVVEKCYKAIPIDNPLFDKLVGAYLTFNKEKTLKAVANIIKWYNKNKK